MYVGILRKTTTTKLTGDFLATTLIELSVIARTTRQMMIPSWSIHNLAPGMAVIRATGYSGNLPVGGSPVAPGQTDSGSNRAAGGSPAERKELRWRAL